MSPFHTQARGDTERQRGFTNPVVSRAQGQLVLGVEFTVVHALCCLLDYKVTIF